MANSEVGTRGNFVTDRNIEKRKDFPMKVLASQHNQFVEQIAQEERAERRRAKIKNLVKNIRDWWNHQMNSGPSYHEIEERIRETRTKYEQFRGHF